MRLVRASPDADGRRRSHHARNTVTSPCRRSNTPMSATSARTWAISPMIVGCRLGMDVRICGPKSLWPSDDYVKIARDLEARYGAADKSMKIRRKPLPAPVSFTRRLGLDGRGNRRFDGSKGRCSLPLCRDDRQGRRHRRSQGFGDDHYPRRGRDDNNHGSRRITGAGRGQVQQSTPASG